MKALLFVSVLLMLNVLGCEKQTIKKAGPDCLADKIEVFKKEACEKGATVKEYTFQSKTVYVFYPGNCGADMASEVVDAECTTLGYLDGLMGNKMINDEDFSKAEYIKTIWEN